MREMDGGNRRRRECHRVEDDEVGCLDAALVGARAWSMAHGLAMLMLNGQVPINDSLIRQAMEARPMSPAADTSLQS